MKQTKLPLKYRTQKNKANKQANVKAMAIIREMLKNEQ